MRQRHEHKGDKIQIQNISNEAQADRGKTEKSQEGHWSSTERLRETEDEEKKRERHTQLGCVWLIFLH